MLALFPVAVVGSCTCETKDLYHIRPRSPATDSAQPYSGLSVRASSGCREVCQNLLLPAVYIQFPNSFNFNLFPAITFFLGDTMLIHYGFFAEPKVSALGTSAFHIQNLWFPFVKPVVSALGTYAFHIRNLWVVFPKPGVLFGCSGFRLWEFFHMRNELAGRSCFYNWNRITQLYSPHPKRGCSGVFSTFET